MLRLFRHLLSQPAARECCKQLETLKLRREAENHWTATCLVCGAVHHRMRAEPGVIGVVR